MNQQAFSQDNKEDKDLAPGEFVYEFFQPVFTSTFNFEIPATPTQALTPVPTVPPALTPSQAVEIHTTESASSQTQSEKWLDRQTTDDSGAVIWYGRWNIRPHRIKYPDRSVAEFEYDESERLVRVLDRDGMEWTRITQPDHRNISTWKSSEGQTCDMSMVVIPDGTYQVISSAGVIQTCTLSGRIVVWTPFTAGFDLKRTLFAIFRSIDKNQDSSLSKEELELAARQIWQESDAIQLISMMQSHFDAICASRRHALCRQGSGITIDDILSFDEATKLEQDSRCAAPLHAVAVVRTLFDELDIAGEGAVSMNQVRIAYDKRHERDNVSKAILQTMYEEMRNQFEGKNAAFAAKANYLTRSDLVQYYKDGYKREIRGHIQIAGWGTDECLQASETSTRTLFVDPANAMESIVPQAIQRRENDPALGIFNAVFESLIVQCPHLVVRMISPTVDGRFKVTFPGEANPITVNAPTSSCLAEYLHGSKFGFWMAVIENAYEQYENVRTGTQDLDHLQAVERICRLLNGQSGRWINTTDMPLTELNTFMRNTFKQRRIMIAAGLRNSPRMNGNRFISKSAVCGVTNFDHRGGRVTVSDPLRDNSADNFSDPTHRNADGSTTLSLSAFSAAFDKIYVEDWLATADMLQK